MSGFASVRPRRTPGGSRTVEVEEDKAGQRGLLDRLLRQERENIRLVAALAAPPQFGDVFELYRASGFLYAGKLAALQGYMPLVERTWAGVLAPGCQVSRLVARFGFVDGALRLRNAISAYEYAPGTWQGQHLVSRERHEYTGTLAVLIELVEGLHHEGAAHIRLSFRPNNPGTMMLFGEVPRRVASEYCKLSVCDYGCVPRARVRLAPSPTSTLTVRAVTGDERALAEDFYRRILHPVELASLALDDPEFRRLDSSYAGAGLRRRRQVLVAGDHGEILGACLVHDSSLGLNLSFLENALEHLTVRPDLPAARRQEVWIALAAAAVVEGRSPADNVVVTLDPSDRDLSIDTGLIAPDPKQYAVLTVARRGDGYLRSIDCFVDYYRDLLAAESEK